MLVSQRQGQVCPTSVPHKPFPSRRGPPHPQTWLILYLLPPFLFPHAACLRAPYLNPVPKAELSVTSSRKSPLITLSICLLPLVLYCSEASVVLLCGGTSSNLDWKLLEGREVALQRFAFSKVLGLVHTVQEYCTCTVLWNIGWISK